MSEIKYTPEMEMQDQLWTYEKENMHLMNHLQRSIINAFLRQNNLDELYFNVYFNDNESIVDVYGPKDISDDGHIIRAKSFGNCQGLVKYLNRTLHQEQLAINQIKD